MQHWLKVAAEIVTLNCEAYAATAAAAAAILGICDDDKGLCYCDGPVFGRIPAAPGSPPGTPPRRVGRPLPEYCQPSAVSNE
jgi:hypothetical protein